MARTKALDQGDEVEVWVQTEVALPNGQSITLGARAKGHVRTGESGPRTFRRVAKFVEDQLDRKIQEVSNSGQ